MVDISGSKKHISSSKNDSFLPKMKIEAKQTYANCVRCGARKIITHALRGTLWQMAAWYQRIAMDIVGPLPRTIRNNRYLLVVIEYYTRWPEAFAIEHQDAHSVALRLISDIISRYGAPYIIHTDEITNFESKLIGELLRTLRYQYNANDPVIV